MAVAHGVSTQSSSWTTTPDPFTFSHAGGTSPVPTGVVVLIYHGGTGNDLITSVTYGGVTMNRIATGVDSAGEQGRTYAYFLGRGVPTGTQTVSIDHTATADVKQATCITITSTTSTPTDAAAFGNIDGNQADPQIALDSGTSSAIRYCAIMSGAPNVTDLTNLASMSTVDSADPGAFIMRTDRQTSPSTGSFTIGWTAATDDVAMVAIAVAEAILIVTPAADVATLADAPTVNIIVPPLLISTPTDTAVSADIAPTVQRWANVWLGTVTIVSSSGPLITTPLDTVTLTDSVSIRLPFLVVSASDAITLFDDSLTMFLPRLVLTTSDLVTLSDPSITVMPSGMLLPSALDTLTVLDLAPVFFFSRWNIDIADILTLSEGPLSILETPLRLNVSDLLTGAETVTVFTSGTALRPSVLDVLSITQGTVSAGTNPVRLVVSETLTLGEGNVYVIRYTNSQRAIYLADTLTLADVRYVRFPEVMEPLVPIGLVPTGLIPGSSTTPDLIEIQTEDILTLVDLAPAVLEPVLKLSVLDAAALFETVLVREPVLPLLVSDLITSADTTVTLQLTPLLVQASDLITMAEGTLVIRTVLTLTIAPAADVVITSDIAPVFTFSLWNIAAADTVTASEGPLTVVEPILPLTALDLLTLVDAGASLQEFPLLLQVSELLTMAEGTVTVSTVVGRSITPSADVLTLTDIAPVFRFSLWNIFALDAIALSEATLTVREPTLPIAASDILTISDQGATLRFSKLFLSVLDTATLAEAAPVIASGQLRFLVTDSITLVDGPASLTLSIPFISQPGIVISIPSRDMSVTATVTLSVVSIPARDMSIEASPRASSISVPARDMSITATVTISRVSVPARDMSIAA